jgi:hypothetical protein
MGVRRIEFSICIHSMPAAVMHDIGPPVSPKLTDCGVQMKKFTRNANQGLCRVQQKSSVSRDGPGQFHRGDSAASCSHASCAKIKFCAEAKKSNGEMGETRQCEINDRAT